MFPLLFSMSSFEVVKMISSYIIKYRIYSVLVCSSSLLKRYDVYTEWCIQTKDSRMSCESFYARFPKNQPDIFGIFGDNF